MRKYFLLLIVFLVSSVSFAKLQGDGFYRVQNVGSQRYLYVYDNTGKINISTTSADMGAIQLWKNHERTLYDPASIIYIKKVGNVYDLLSQGTGVHAIIGYYVTLYETSAKYYQVYAEGKYLSDGETSQREKGGLDTNVKGDYRNWLVLPIDTEDEYFGVAPSVESKGKFYAPFYASFGFSFASSGMKAYYINKVDNGQAVLCEIKSSTIPASMPVLIMCENHEPSSNKLNLLMNNETKPQDNMLSGVYFNNPGRPKSADARKKYDPATMRVLGITSNGELGFVKYTEEYLPANQSYLVVPEGTPDELKVVTKEEFVSGAVAPLSDNNAINTIYTPWGMKVGENESDINRLPKGTYIIGNKKVQLR